MLIPSHAAESLLTLTLTVSFLLCEMGTALWLPVFESTGGGSSVVLVPLLTPQTHTYTRLAGFRESSGNLGGMGQGTKLDSDSKGEPLFFL